MALGVDLTQEVLEVAFTQGSLAVDLTQVDFHNLQVALLLKGVGTTQTWHLQDQMCLGPEARDFIQELQEATLTQEPLDQEVVSILDPGQNNLRLQTFCSDRPDEVLLKHQSQ